MSRCKQNNEISYIHTFNFISNIGLTIHKHNTELASTLKQIIQIAISDLAGGETY